MPVRMAPRGPDPASETRAPGATSAILAPVWKRHQPSPQAVLRALDPGGPSMALTYGRAATRARSAQTACAMEAASQGIRCGSVALETSPAELPPAPQRWHRRAGGPGSTWPQGGAAVDDPGGRAPGPRRG